jgi:hypothetical protein
MMTVVGRAITADARPKVLYTYTVEGFGYFPFDMLRYDDCRPKSEAETGRLLPIDHRGTPEKKKRQVTMVGYRKPTEARWASFGWQVL